MVTALLSIAHLLGVFFLALIAAALLFNMIASLIHIPPLKTHFQNTDAHGRLHFLGAFSIAPIVVACFSLIAVALLASFPQYADDHFHWHHAPEQFNWHGASGIAGLIGLAIFTAVKTIYWKKAQQQLGQWQQQPERVQQATAFSYGSGEGNIFISPALAMQLDEKELNIVTAHEQAHCHYHDPIKLYLCVCVYQLLFFPVRKVLSQQYYLAMEERADIKTSGSGFDRFDIARTLIKVARLKHRSSDFTTVCAFSSSCIAERVDALSRSAKSPSKPLTVFSIALLALAINLVFSIDSIHHLSESVLFYFF
ncbi:M56 family metallopeptidase [Pseudoteredinibacter isoporae]|uniref:M56 family metallopeptidase n=1 Tax=Pseudoteredinibacter isoporae TaxID=570281 RepID=UPI0031056474